jgi:hypothetical protein
MIVQGAERPKYGGQQSFVRMRLAHPCGQSQRSGLLCRNVRSWDSTVGHDGEAMVIRGWAKRVATNRPFSRTLRKPYTFRERRSRPQWVGLRRNTFTAGDPAIQTQVLQTDRWRQTPHTRNHFPIIGNRASAMGQGAALQQPVAETVLFNRYSCAPGEIWHASYVRICLVHPERR